MTDGASAAGNILLDQQAFREWVLRRSSRLSGEDACGRGLPAYRLRARYRDLASERSVGTSVPADRRRLGILTGRVDRAPFEAAIGLGYQVQQRGLLVGRPAIAGLIETFGEAAVRFALRMKGQTAGGGQVPTREEVFRFGAFGIFLWLGKDAVFRPWLGFCAVPEAPALVNRARLEDVAEAAAEQLLGDQA